MASGSGHEIVTVGMGNFATLTCAQWVNGATRFDAERNVIFMERRSGEFVPRLLLLDAGHAAVVAEERPFDALGAQPAAMQQFTEAEVRRAIIKHVGLASATDLESCDEEADDAGEDEADRRALERGRAHADPNGTMEAASRSEEMTANDEAAVEIFAKDDALVPWHLYIKTKLHSRTYGHLRHGHSDPRGLGLLHSYGHGLAALKPSVRAECAELADNLRYMLEACDACQGVQLFVDADGAFGGAAQQLLHDFRDNFGPSLPVVTVPAFNPPQFSPDDDFQRQRMQEVLLNEALCFALLAGPSDLFVPFNISKWGSSLWRESDAAAAQVVATAYDTATYACRQEAFDDFWPMRQYCSLLRPQKGLSVCSALLSMPTRIPEEPEHHYREQRHPVHLWSALEANPLLSAKCFLPLSFATPSFKNVDAALAEGFVYPFLDTRSLVLAHAFALRGLGGLPDEVYQREEALVRYALPLRSTSFKASIFSEAYPISDTFPRASLLGAPAAEASPDDGKGAAGLSAASSVPVTSHLACTFAAGPHLAELALGARATHRLWKHVHQESYQMEEDEWLEALEALDALRDEYDREIPSDDGDIDA